VRATELLVVIEGTLDVGFNDAGTHSTTQY